MFTPFVVLHMTLETILVFDHQILLFLIQAVNESLKSVNLFHSGFGDKSVNKYSGGMKRRLSVAIALIGNPKVVNLP